MDRLMFNRRVLWIVCIWLVMLNLLPWNAYTQKLTKLSSTPAFDEYELLNDSLHVAPAFELLADYQPGAQSFQILELRSSAVPYPADKITNLAEAYNLGADVSAIEALNPGTVKGKQKISLRIHVSRTQSGKQEFSITKYLKFRVFKQNTPTQRSRNSAIGTSADRLFASGVWYKIPVRDKGIYQIDRAYLESLGINISQVDPRNIQIWGTSGDEIPPANSIPREEITEIPIRVSGESDGQFNQGDVILFYGDDTSKLSWDSVNRRFFPTIHPYSDFNHYFLTIADTPGRRLSPVNTNFTPTGVATVFKDLIWLEEELHKVEDKIKSGREWLGQRFLPQDRGLVKTVLRDTIPGIIPNQQAFFLGQFVGRSTVSMSFDVNMNEASIGRINLSPITSYISETGNAGTLGVTSRSINSTFANEIVEVTMRMNHNEPSSEGFLDWIRIYVDREYTAKNGYLFYFAPQNGASGQVLNYVLNNFQSEPMILDVSNPVNPRLLAGSFSGQQYIVPYTSDPQTQFIAQTRFLRPEPGVQIPNQDLKNVSTYPDYIIITAEPFLEQARELAAYREQKDGFTTIIATQNQIFNEFSAGTPDATALREYVRFLYNRALNNNQPTPSYLLLFGNTTFDFKGRLNTSQTNHVFTYQSRESLQRTATFATDDYFGLLDDDEGNLPEGTTTQRIDLGIGRLPVENLTEARTVIEKIRRYDNEQNPGDWANLFTFAADDDFPDTELNRDLHVLNSEGTLTRMNRQDAAIRFKRIYEFSYPVELTGSGRKIPEATRDFVDTINNGTIVLNYSGHGNEQVLSDEEIFQSDLINQLTNIDKLTIFVTATCQFGRFDDSDDQSGAEKLVLSPIGGAIASFTTTRVVFTGASISTSNNFGLNIELSQRFIEKDDDGKPSRFGDIYFRTKNTSVGGSRNTRKFILIGDPATRIRLPEQKVSVESISGAQITADTTLTIRALDTVEMAGILKDNDGNPLNTFNGSVNITVLDAPRSVRLPERNWVLEGRCNLDDCAYDIQSDVLFRGRANVQSGAFSTQFIIPKDISFSERPGRILLYANDGSQSAGGSYENVVFNGINPNAQNDGKGPEIDVYLNDKNFVNGNLVNATPNLIVELFDDSGINTTGTGIGHEIIATINTVPQRTIVLNEFFEGNIDDFRSGKIEFQIPELPEGRYTLKVRAWDVQNNPSEKEIVFEVAESQQLQVRNVYNYPNPMHNRTQFMFEHNQPGNLMDVSVRIFTLSGRPVQQLQETIITASSYASISWDGRDRDHDRLGNGTYIYVLRVAADTPEGRKTFEKIEKLVIIR